MTASWVAITAARFASIASSHSAMKPSGSSATPSSDNNSYTTSFRTPYTSGLASMLLVGGSPTDMRYYPTINRKEDGMRSTVLTENLTQLTRWRFVNAFLVREEDGLTLVDTTLGGGAGALIAAAEEAGGAIRRIAMTHGHGDHVGSLDALKERLGVEVLMPDVDARIHAGEKVVDGKLTGSWPKLQTVPDVRLNAGDRVGSLEVVASP